jgi:hypothetical protein
MLACVFYTGYFPREARLAGFHAQYRLLEVVPGRGGSYRMDRGPALAGAAPVGQGTPVSESIVIVDDPYEVREAFRHGPGVTDRTGIFQDNYLISYPRNLPFDFRFVFEQTYSVRSEAVLDASRLTATPRAGPELQRFRNRVTFASEHPEFKVLLQTSDGRGGWRYVWGDRTGAIGVDPPPRPDLPLR